MHGSLLRRLKKWVVLCPLHVPVPRSRAAACYQGVERALSKKRHSASLRVDQVPPKDIADKSMVQ